MPTTLTCQSCGATLAGGDGCLPYCPACLLRQGLFSTQSSQPAAPEAKSPPPLFGSYELIEEIGRGGMGVVYKARQQSLKRTVALKLLVSGAYSSEALLRRFQLEAEAAAGLQHPGIVAIFECGEHENQPYYAMEFVNGRNLAEVCNGHPLPPGRSAAYARAIAEAVQYAHQRGILHRDLKPSNVLIDQDDRPRITDFGLAKRLHGPPDVTLAGQVIGSPNYASPEQTSGRQAAIGVASDVYSLGALLFHLLTGRPPFLAGTMQETLRLVQENDPLPPHTLNPDVPRDLDTICLKSLEKDPARRYASAQAFADELARFLKGEPIRARAVSPLERGWRWCRRHPAIASLAATVAIVLTASSFVFYSSARRIEMARAEEQAARELAEINLYAADMQVMSRAYKYMTVPDPHESAMSLDRARPQSGQPDWRGFEWRYFWTMLRNDALAVFRGHNHVVTSGLISPDGRLAATQSFDGVLKIWDAATTSEVVSLDGVFRTGGFTPNSQELIFSRPDQSLWRLAIASRVATRVLPASGQLIALRPDGRDAVVFGPEGTPVLQSLQPRALPVHGSALPPGTCAVVSADGGTAAVAAPPFDHIVVVNLRDGRKTELEPPPPARRMPTLAIALSPDGRQLASTGFDGRITIWDTERGAAERAFRAFLDPVWGVAYSPDGRLLAAGGNNRLVKVWDTTTWDEVASHSGHQSTVASVAFSPDGQRILTGGEDEIALILPVKSRHKPTVFSHLLRGPDWHDRVASIAFSPDSRFFAGTAADGTVKVWTTDAGEIVTTIPVEARTVAFAPDGKSVLTESYDGFVQRWTTAGDPLDAEGRTNPRRPAAKPSFANWQVDPLTPSERVALVAEQAETRAKSGLCEISNSRDAINAGAILSSPTIAMSPDGGTMYLGLPDGTVEAWDVPTRARRLVFNAHKLGITALAVSADGRYLATGARDNNTKLWEAGSGQLLATFFAHNRPVWALAFSPDGTTLASGSCDKEIILCSVPLRRHVASLPLYTGTPGGFEDEVRLVKFSPDGNILAAGLGDGTLRFFRAASFSETDLKPNQAAR